MDLERVKEKIIALPKDQIRYIDSLDYYFSPDDTIHVNIYSQNYAYISFNKYKLVKDKGNRDGILSLYKVSDFDVKMKSEIEDIEKYRNDEFDLKIVEGKNGGNKDKHGFIIEKNFDNIG